MEEKKWGPVHFLPGPNKGKYPNCHSVYLDAEKKVLIDPASDRETLKKLGSERGVDAVWLSHYHEDHFMHLDLFDQAELWIAEPDEPPLGDLDTFLDYYGMYEQSQREFWRQIMLEQFHYRPRRADRYFRDGETIDLGRLTVRVMLTPGHTPGHVAFLFQEPEVLFMGDYDLTRFGPWYGDVRSSIEATEASVEALSRVPAKVRLTCHEHGVFEEDPGDLWQNYLNVIRDREARLWELLDLPRTMAEIIDARILYKKKREPKEFYDFGERVHMEKHLERLIAQGRVVHEDGVYRKAT